MLYSQLCSAARNSLLKHVDNVYSGTSKAAFGHVYVQETPVFSFNS